MSELFTENGINQDTLKEYLGDAYYNDPEKQQPTKLFDNVKDEKTFVNNYLNAQKMISSHGEKLKKATEGLVKVPGENATKEEIAAYRKAVGVPDKPEDYKFNIPANASEFDKKGFELIANVLKPVVHEEGISPSKISRVFDKVVESLAHQNAELQKQGQALLDADIQSMKEKYKDKYDSVIKSGDDGLVKFDYKDNPVGTNFKNLIDTYGIGNAPAVREFLYEVSKLVLSDDVHLMNNQGSGNEDSWPVDYSKVVKS